MHLQYKYNKLNNKYTNLIFKTIYIIDTYAYHLSIIIFKLNLHLDRMILIAVI